MEKVAVVGATSAIAMEAARLFAARGAELYLVARDPQKLAAIAADLRARGARKVETCVADLNEAARHPEILDSAARALGRIDVFLAAQGLLGDASECEKHPEAAELVLRTNFVAPAMLLQVAANRLVEQGGGTLVAISSVAGDRGRGSNYVYGSAKGGLSLFLQGLRNRCHSRGVAVLTVKPGFVDTPMTAGIRKNALFVPPSTVGAAIVRAIERRRDVAYVPGFWRWIMLAIRLIPERVFKRMSL